MSDLDVPEYGEYDDDPELDDEPEPDEDDEEGTEIDL